MIYLDNAATTRPDQDAVRGALSLLNEEFYNPSALYKEGFSAHKRLEEARKSILSHVADVQKYSLVFTSCGSEADNQAIFSFARRGNFVTTEGEHAAVYQAAQELSRRGVEVRFARLDRFGRADEADLLRLVDENTSLVSAIHVNNETGAINDIASLAKKVKAKNPRTVFHSDGVQAFGKLPFRMTDGIDLYSVSAHKIGGVRGAGALIYAKNRKLSPVIFGGGQEGGYRSGTENTFAAVQFSLAAEKKFKNIEPDMQKARRCNALFRETLHKNIFSVISAEDASPYILCISAKGLRGEVLLHMINDRGVIVGTGSACSSRNRFSRVILACGADERTADGILRISFSAETTEGECAEAVRIINECADTLAEKTK